MVQLVGLTDSREGGADSPLTLDLTLFIDSGPFAGTSGGTTMKATVLSGDCSAPITSEFLAGGLIHFTTSAVVL